MKMQLVKMVVMMKSENKGCTKMYIATRRIGLNGSRIHMASVALNRKMSFPLLTTTNVWKVKCAHLVRSYIV